jgi:hypothetical protein
MMCLECGEWADRISEGLENDAYRCNGCGRGFSVDWRRGQPTEPTWPETPEGLAEARRLFAIMKASRRTT